MQGNEGHNFQGIYGLAVDNQNNILCTHHTAHKIHIFDPKGETLQIFGEGGSDLGKITQPAGIAVNHEGQIYVADCGNDRISIFSQSGEFIGAFGQHGADDGKFDGPWGISLDSDSNVIVCDLDNFRIQIFNSQGEFLNKVEYSFGPKKEIRMRPSFAVLDPEGNLIVADYDADGSRRRVLVFEGNNE